MRKADNTNWMGHQLTHAPSYNKGNSFFFQITHTKAAGTLETRYLNAVCKFSWRKFK